MKCKLRSRPIYFSLNVYVLLIVTRQQLGKQTILDKIVSYLNFIGKIQKLVHKSPFTLFQNIKSNKKMLMYGLCIFKCYQ